MPTAAPERVIQGLPYLRWRGLAAHAELADFDFSHAQAPRAYPLIDGKAHDWMGMDAIPIKARLFFLNTVQKNSFPALWEQWRDALFDGSSGDLDHPVLGPLRARVMAGSVSVNAKQTAGVIVDVSWEQTNDDLDTFTIFEGVTISVISAAQAATAACEALGIEYPDGEGDGLSLFDAVNAIESAVFSATLSTTGLINKTTGKVEQMIEAAERLTDPQSWVAITNLQTVWTRLNDVKLKVIERAAGARPTKTVVLVSDTALDAFATEKGNSMADIASLNPSALAKPIVPKGSALTYYA
jgi:hypothetical protein